jgi:formylglycine-generating enzyme required for sulfatase activity
LAQDERRAVTDALVERYRNAVDAGTHSAAWWALRQLQEEPPELETSAEPVAGRDWFVNGRQMTMLKVPAGKFRMGNPENPQSVRPPEITLTRPFYVCDREVSARLFEQFLKDPKWPESEKPLKWPGFNTGYIPTPDCAAAMLNWYDAIRFCNWLSDKEGKKRCYSLLKTEPAGKGDGRAETWEWDFGATGYRLPTEAEWEYMSRAGTTTPYYFGADPKLLTDYGYFLVNSDTHTWPGGTKLPNAWGLFDTLGNAAEWCWDWYGDEDNADKKDPCGPKTGKERIWRGSHYFSMAPHEFRIDYHGGRYEPGQRYGFAGLRVVFTAVPENAAAGER